MTPLSTAGTRPTQLTVVPDAPPLEAAIATDPQPTHFLVCDECELESGPMAQAEAQFLARIHDQLQHRSCPTAHVDDRAGRDGDGREERRVA